MKRNLNEMILTLDGVPFDDNSTLKTICFSAVTSPHRSDENSTVEQKMKLYSLAIKINTGGVVDFTAEEISVLKERIGKLFGHVIVFGRAFELLEKDYIEVQNEPLPTIA